MSKENEISKLFMEVIPPAMHFLRQELRKNAGDDLTIPQFRILVCINKGMTCIGEIAQHHGVSQPAMSRMVDILCHKGLLTRKEKNGDRRYQVLSLTSSGKSALKKIKKEALKNMEVKMDILPAKELETLLDSLKTIERFVTTMKERIK